MNNIVERDIEQYFPPAGYKCEECEYDMYADEVMFYYDGKWLCGECFRERVLDDIEGMSDKELAEFFKVDSATASEVSGNG